jgi:hypothetical protein
MGIKNIPEPAWHQGFRQLLFKVKGHNNSRNTSMPMAKSIRLPDGWLSVHYNPQVAQLRSV